MKFLLDANLPYSSADIFKNFNRKTEHSRKIGLGKVTDKEIIKYAIKNNQILVTKDLGFGDIRKYPIKEHKGIIILRVPFYYVAKQINEVLFNFLESIKKRKIEIENSLTIIEINKFRIRK